MTFLSLNSTGSGEGGVPSPEGSVSDERPSEEQTEGGAEGSEDSGERSQTLVRRTDLYYWQDKWFTLDNISDINTL